MKPQPFQFSLLALFAAMTGLAIVAWIIGAGEQAQYNVVLIILGIVQAGVIYGVVFLPIALMAWIHRQRNRDE